MSLTIAMRTPARMPVRMPVRMPIRMPVRMPIRMPMYAPICHWRIPQISTGASSSQRRIAHHAVQPQRHLHLLFGTRARTNARTNARTHARTHARTVAFAKVREGNAEMSEARLHYTRDCLKTSKRWAAPSVQRLTNFDYFC